VLRHLKSRYGECRDLPLLFDGAHQRFTPAAGVAATGGPDAGRLQSALAALWARTAPADHDGDSDA